MMPVADGNNSDGVNYKKKYKALKRKLRLMVYEQECFNEELRKAQRRLLKLSRDRSFLLDRLMQYETLNDTSSDSDATASSDSEAETKDVSGKKKKNLHGVSGQMAANILHSPAYQSLLASHSLALMGGSKSGEPPKKRAKVTKKGQKSAVGKVAVGSIAMASALKTSLIMTPPPGHMTREELERHLEAKQNTNPQFLSIEKTPHSLPDDIFSHDNSNPDSELLEVKKEELDLIIDVP